jgi:hypothetical protein
MFEFTKDNFFKFGYEDTGWFVNRTSPTQKFICEYGPASSRMGFRDANVAAAKYIASIATDDIYIMMSGGADSEITAWSFIDAGIPFKAAIMRFDNNKNEHDISWAQKFCAKHNIPIVYYDIEIEEFLLGDQFERIIRKYQTTTERAASIWCADQIPGFAVLGQGEPVVTKSFGKWWFQEKEKICTWNKYWIFNDRPGIPGFHQFSPEQMLAVLEDQMTLDLIDDKTEYWSNDKFKHQFYRKHYPEFEIRTKYAGFERLSKTVEKCRTMVLSTFPYVNGEWQVPIEQALEIFRPAEGTIDV